MYSKKRRLSVGPQLGAMLSELDEDALPVERVQLLVLEILRAQISQIMQSAREGEYAHVHEPFAPPLSEETRICDIMDSRLAVMFNGWIFRQLAAEIHTQEILESSITQLAKLVISARAQGCGARI
jgi:hypothetical protein